jgi:hypothetical protein
MLNKVYSEMDSRYATLVSALPSSKVLYSIFFNEEITVDTEVIQLISQSFITNHLSIISSNMKITPSISLVMLSKYFYSVSMNGANSIVKEFASFVNKRFEAIIYSIGDYDNLEKFLEIFLENWIQIRYAIAMNRRKERFTFLNLFSLKHIAAMSSTLKKKLNRQLCLTDEVSNIDFVEMVNLSYDDQTLFVNELESFEVSIFSPFFVIKPHPGEACDLILKVFCGNWDTDNTIHSKNNKNNNYINNDNNNDNSINTKNNIDNCFYCFLKCKSANEATKKKAESTKSDATLKKMKSRTSLKEEKRPQYEQIKKSIENNIALKDFCYIYVSSDNYD